VTATRLDDVTTVVLAPNPGPLTLDGTNTYLLGVPGSGALVVVDPGPDLPAHRAAVEAAVARADAQVAAVVVTHHHPDHADAAGWATAWGARLLAGDPELVEGAERVPDGTVVEAGGVAIEAVATPGHASDHLCLRVRATGVVLTGDHVLGRGTTVVAWPDGDMGQYLQSLRRLGGLGAARLYPGHGPPLDDPAAVVADYLAHRMQREEQVVAALTAGDRTAAEVVARVYADVDPALHPAAQRSVRAHLDKLVADGRASRTDGGWRVERGA